MKGMKYHPHGSVLFITFSVEEGLLLLSNPLCQAIVKSCLAAAQYKYPVKICHFIVQATHLHLVIVVDNPADVEGFVRYFKTESAHMLNRMIGRKKRTIWCEGYDSPIVLTPLRTLITIAYIYANPSKDNIETSIDKYPNLSSWKMFRKNIHIKHWKLLRRPSLQALPQSMHSLEGYTRAANVILRDIPHTLPFTLSPNAWMEAFNIFSPEEQNALNEKILNRVRTLEERAEAKRIKEGKTIIGREKLLREIVNLLHRPNRKGKRMWCLSERRKLRMAFISFLKDLFTRARSVRQRWFLGDFSQPYPPGLYPPSLPKLAEPLAAW